MHSNGTNANEDVKTRPAPLQRSCSPVELTLVQNKSTLRWLRAVKEDIADLENLPGAVLDWEKRGENLTKGKALLAELEEKVAPMPAEELAATEVALKAKCPPLQQANENVECRRASKKGSKTPAEIMRSETISALRMTRDCHNNVAYLQGLAVRSEEDKEELKFERELLAELKAVVAAMSAEDLAAAGAWIAGRR